MTLNFGRPITIDVDYVTLDMNRKLPPVAPCRNNINPTLYDIIMNGSSSGFDGASFNGYLVVLLSF